MQNFIKTIVNAIQHWTERKIKDSTANMATVEAVQKVVQEAQQIIIPAIEAAQTTADGKMNANNPVGTGSFSMGREEGSIVGEDSFSIGNATRATAKNAVSEGEGTVANFCNMKASGAYNDFSTYAETITASNMSVPGNWYAATGTAYSMSENGFKLEGTVNTLVELSAVPVGSYIITKLASNEESGNLTTGTKMYHILSNTPVGTRNNRYIEYEQHSLALADSNKKGAFIHVVGNGTSETERSNAYTLDWEGNAWYQGDVYVGSTSGTNKDEGSKKLATEEYVDNKVSTITALPNPNTLTINGTTYNGSAAVDMTDTVVNAVLAALPTWNGGSY